jgi:hypothetical protein
MRPPISALLIRRRGSFEALKHTLRDYEIVRKKCLPGTMQEAESHPFSDTYTKKEVTPRRKSPVSHARRGRLVCLPDVQPRESVSFSKAPSSSTGNHLPGGVQGASESARTSVSAVTTFDPEVLQHRIRRLLMTTPKPRVCRYHPNAVRVPDVGYDTHLVCLACVRGKPAEGAKRQTRRNTDTAKRDPSIRDSGSRYYPAPPA